MDYEFVVLCDLQNLPFLDSLIILSSVCLYTVCWLVFLMLRISFVLFCSGSKELSWIFLYNFESLGGIQLHQPGSDNTVILPTDSM